MQERREYSPKPPELISSERRKISKEGLSVIFGKDIERLVREKLQDLGIISAENEVNLLDNPDTHKYKDDDGVVTESHGQYFLETIMGKHGVLAYYLPPKSETSEHFHEKPIREEYHPIAGEAFATIGEDGEEVVLKPGMSAVIVPFNAEHKVITKDGHAFVLVIMRNAGPIPRDKWHKPTKKGKK